jgi:hypothetical protein
VAAPVALAEAAHLAWEAAHGGIVSHHLLNDASLPALWNGWGLLSLPLLAWVAAPALFERRGAAWHACRGGVLRLLCAAMGGVALSIAFATGTGDTARIVLIGLLLSAPVVRAYRAEWLLGFALGMAFTFGGLLPLLVGGVIGLVSAAAWGLRRIGGWAIRRARTRWPAAHDAAR